MERAMSAKLGLIGRDRWLANRVARIVHDRLSKEFDYGKLRDTDRGQYFEIVKNGPDEPDVRRVYRVTVELDRVES
jgi:hypothetical protein